MNEIGFWLNTLDFIEIPGNRMELAELLNISDDLQLSYITNVDAGNGLMKVGKLYSLMTTEPGERQ